MGACLGEATRKLKASYTEIIYQLLEELRLELGAERKKRELSLMQIIYPLKTLPGFTN